MGAADPDDRAAGPPDPWMQELPGNPKRAREIVRTDHDAGDRRVGNQRLRFLHSLLGFDLQEEDSGRFQPEMYRSKSNP